MTDHLAYAPACELLQLMDRRELTSRALLEIFIARIEDQNPRINAVVATCYETARHRADAADRARAAGESWGLLHGLPMTIKDTFEVSSMPCVAGDPKLKSHRPTTNATVVQRLLDAGAIIFGKTNVPWQARDFQSYNRVYGTTVNPWDERRSPGGSSGGSAAALAAGFTPLEVGSDLSGSIRIPSHHCGVFGHKSTLGVIPLHGHIPGPPQTTSGIDLWVAGPLARSVEDLELLFKVLAEPAWVKESESSTFGRDQNEPSLGQLRFMFWTDDPICEIESDMTEGFRNLAHQLREKGAEVTFGAPGGCDLQKVCSIFLNQLASVTEMGAPAVYRRLLYFFSPLYKVLQPFLRLPRLFEHYSCGAGQSDASWRRHYEMRQALRATFLEVFQTHDVVITPVAPNAALKHQRFLPLSLRSMTVNGKRRHYTDQLMWVSVASLFGLPATAVPLGHFSDGLPFGLQVMGAPHDDLRTMRIAREITSLIGGFQKPTVKSDAP